MLSRDQSPFMRRLAASRVRLRRRAARRLQMSAGRLTSDSGKRHGRDDRRPLRFRPRQRPQARSPRSQQQRRDRRLRSTCRPSRCCRERLGRPGQHGDRRSRRWRVQRLRAPKRHLRRARCETESRGKARHGWLHGKCRCAAERGATSTPTLRAHSRRQLGIGRRQRAPSATAQWGRLLASARRPRRRSGEPRFGHIVGVLDGRTTGGAPRSTTRINGETRTPPGKN